MRELKSNSVLRLFNNYLIDSPQPINLNYFWNIGSLLSISLITQIITGITLAMHYNPSVTEAFNSLEHIMRDVNNGWLIRFLHGNIASAFFFLVYLHIGRGIFSGSYKKPRALVWTIGTIIFILMMATAFLGYNLSPKWFNKDNKDNKLNKYSKLNKYNKVNYSVDKILLTKKILRLNIKRYYSTGSYSYKPEISEILEKIIHELGINPVYIYEDLNLEKTRKKKY